MEQYIGSEEVRVRSSEGGCEAQLRSSCIHFFHFEKLGPDLGLWFGGYQNVLQYIRDSEIIRATLRAIGFSTQD